MVHNNPAWDSQKLEFERDGKLADEKLGGDSECDRSEPEGLQSPGGKLILYHGWNDAALPPLNTINYFESVRTRLGRQEADSFMRLFMAPGMQHCAGGPGPNGFGNFVTSAQSDPEHDLTMASSAGLNMTPRRIKSSRQERRRQIPRSPVIRTRPLCAFPRVARYKGSGSTDEAANFTCVTEKE